MRGVFADTGYWIALVNPNDGLHRKAKEVSQQLGALTLVTSDMVLVEVLNMFAERGTHLRQAAVATVQAVAADPGIEVVPQTRRLFRDAYDLYRTRSDKDWSLTDCASFVIMDERQIGDALTYDGNFVQNGYRALLRDDK